MPASTLKARSRRQWSLAIRRTSFSSEGPTGWKRSKWSWRRKRNSAGSSSSRMCLLARRPWRRPLRLDASLPSKVRGPVDFCAFWRLALIWASVAVLGWSVFFIFVLAGGCGPVFSTLILGEGRGGFGWHFVQVVEDKGEGILVTVICVAVGLVEAVNVIE